MDSAKIPAGISTRNLERLLKYGGSPVASGLPPLSASVCLYPSVSVICLSFGTIIGVIT